jgi:hypothetical protein
MLGGSQNTGGTETWAKSAVNPLGKSDEKTELRMTLSLRHLSLPGFFPG